MVVLEAVRVSHLYSVEACQVRIKQTLGIQMSLFAQHGSRARRLALEHVYRVASARMQVAFKFM